MGMGNEWQEGGSATKEHATKPESDDDRNAPIGCLRGMLAARLETFADELHAKGRVMYDGADRAGSDFLRGKGSGFIDAAAWLREQTAKYRTASSPYRDGNPDDAVARLRNNVRTQERSPGEWFAWIEGTGHGTTTYGANEAEAVCALAATLGAKVDDLEKRLGLLVGTVQRGEALERKVDERITLENGEKAPGFTRPTGPASPVEKPALVGFGEALEALQQGKRVARVGWNGKGMWLALVPGDAWTIENGALPALAFGKIASDTDGFLPWIGMRTADRRFVPWLASQTDMLVADWIVFD